MAGETARQIPRFVIFGSGRVGSRLLVDMLNSHPYIFCEYNMVLGGCPDPNDWLASRVSLARQGGARAYGIRLLVPQLADNANVPDIHGLLKSLESDGWQIIHLCRSNPVRVVISYVHAARKGFHLRAGEGAWQYEPMTLNAEELSNWIEVVSDWMARERDSLQGISVRKLVYERDLATERHQQITVNRISAWLGMQTATARKNLRRQIPDRQLSELIVNYDEVRFLLDRFSEAFPELKTG